MAYEPRTAGIKLLTLPSNRLSILMEQCSANKISRCFPASGMAICLILLFSASYLHAQDDTVGFWKVTDNGKEVSAVTINNESDYFLEPVTDSTVVSVYYYTESPCRNCLCRLLARDTQGVALKTIEHKGYGNNIPFSFSGRDLKTWLPGGAGKFYIYFSGKYDGWMPWEFLGAIKCIPQKAKDK